jgi:CRISPR system Cascade subunit CasE
MTALHRARLVLDRRALVRLAAQHHPRRALDPGYLLHVGLAALFDGDSPVSTFAEEDAADVAGGREPQDDVALVLAYATVDEGGLRTAMKQEHRALVRACSTLPMPPLPSGTRLAFRVRACPVVRTNNPGDHERKVGAKGRPVSREVDAWLAHRFPSWQVEPPREGSSFERAGREWMERQTVYASWLRKQLARGDAAEGPGDIILERFQREQLFRRGERRHGAPAFLERPAAILTGTLVVNGAEAFSELLRRGVGRHRAFGFGMLRVRPA